MRSPVAACIHDGEMDFIHIYILTYNYAFGGLKLVTSCTANNSELQYLHMYDSCQTYTTHTIMQYHYLHNDIGIELAIQQYDRIRILLQSQLACCIIRLLVKIDLL